MVKSASPDGHSLEPQESQYNPGDTDFDHFLTVLVSNLPVEYRSCLLLRHNQLPPWDENTTD